MKTNTKLQENKKVIAPLKTALKKPPPVPPRLKKTVRFEGVPSEVKAPLSPILTATHGTLAQLKTYLSKKENRDGCAVLAPASIPDIADGSGHMDGRMVARGIRYFLMWHERTHRSGEQRWLRSRFLWRHSGTCRSTAKLDV